MPSGFSNQPKILRGAFVEFGISLPPLIVVFQFNPVLITRTRTSTVTLPPAKKSDGQRNLDFISQVKKDPKELLRLRSDGTNVVVARESLSFDIRLDATDKLNEGDTLTQQFGVAPQLSTLELMMAPKGQSLMGEALTMLIGSAKNAFSFIDSAKNPPVILFIWGRKKVMPVEIKSMTIKEEEFSADLNPTRATVSVQLEVIEGPNAPFLYTKAMKEVMSLLNLANIGDIANTIVPG
ncbi:MAG TPA: hypothetical protein VFV34_14045 [Blastocatellia bacterium]|nr:hypothetical protein [Blastocatellia bacterium]